MKVLKVIILAGIVAVFGLSGHATNKIKKRDFSIQQVMQEAEAGSADAQCFLGYCMIEGINTNVDYKQAADWLCKAVAQGNKPALFYLASIRYAVDGMDQEYKQAADSLRRLTNKIIDGASSNDFCLKSSWDSNFSPGFYMEDDEKEAMLGQVAKDNPSAMFMLACNEQNKQQRFTWLKRAAELGHAEAQYCLAHELSQNGIEHNQFDVTISAEVVKWLQAAAEQGHLKAIKDLAYCFASDNEFHNDSQAAKYYIQAANLGDKESQLIAGNYYYLGKGLTLNYTEAAKWYKLATLGCNINNEAYSHLGECYFYGKGVKQSYTKAIEYFTKSKHNNSTAMFTLATYYDNNQDQANAVKYYHLAADRLSCLRGNKSACDAALFLGDCYYNGTHGLSPDYKQATYFYSLGKYNMISEDMDSSEWFQKLHEAGGATDSTTYDWDEIADKYGFDWDKFANLDVVRQARQGNPQAQLKLGKKMMGVLIGSDEKEEDPIPECDEFMYDPKNAVTWLRKAADQGNSEALYYLGYCLSIMDYEDKSLQKKILDYYEKAANAGVVKAQVALGHKLSGEYYYSGGDESKGEEAHRWILKAARNGDINAQMTIIDDNGGFDEEAFKWLINIAKQGGCPEAYGILADYYLEGFKGVDINYKKGIEWLTTAANSGDGNAATKLADRYYKGRGVEQDYKKAVHWYSISANAEDLRCTCANVTYGHYSLLEVQNTLGLCYRDGIGVARDYKKAIYWFRRAAEHRNADAQRNLSDCYKKGIGVPVSSSQAEWWLNLSKKGFEEGFPGINADRLM